MQNNCDFAIIIPVWNEEKWIESSYNKLKSFLNSENINADIIFASDGCTDNSVKIIQEIAKKDPRVISFNDNNKLGRGLALNRVFNAVEYPYLMYMDLDLATDLKHIHQILESLKEGADIVTGSRLSKDSVCIRSNKRDFFSKNYNRLTKLLFSSKLDDHQCGFKGFNRKTVLPIVNQITIKGWFWDTELLIRAQKAGLKVVSFPVRWVDRDAEASKVNVWKDAKRMGKDLVNLRWNLFSESFRQLVKFFMVGAINTLISLLILFILDSTVGRGEYGYAIAYAAGAINSFFMNKIITFKQKKFSKKSWLEALLFAITVIIGLTVYNSVGILLEERLGFHYLIAAIGATLSNFMVQFLLSKFLVFSHYKVFKKS